MIVDTNVWLSRWPFRRLPADETPRLAEALRRRGVEQAWAGTFDALLHRDLASANARLADACAAEGSGLLRPFGSVNPRLPDWEEDLRRCHEVHRMQGIRLHPDWHGYRLDDPLAVSLVRAASERGLVVQIALKMEDERTQHPLVRVPRAEAAPLVALAQAAPGARLVVLNALRDVKGPELDRLLAGTAAVFDVAMLEGCDSLEALAARAPDRLVFGSHAPLFTLESALLKIREAGLDGPAARRILCENALRLR